MSLMSLVPASGGGTFGCEGVERGLDSGEVLLLGGTGFPGKSGGLQRSGEAAIGSMGVSLPGGRLVLHLILSKQFIAGTNRLPIATQSDYFLNLIEVHILPAMKKNISHKGINNQGLVENYPPTKGHHPFSYSNYDPSLGMHLLQNTLHHSTKTLHQLRKQKIQPPTQNTSAHPLPISTNHPLHLKRGKNNWTLLQILLKNFSQEAVVRGKDNEEETGKEGVKGEGKKSGSVTHREVVLPVDNSGGLEWRKEQMKKVMGRHCSDLGVRMQAVVPGEGEPWTVHRSREKGKVCHKQVSSLAEIHGNQVSSPLVHDQKITLIQIKKYHPKTVTKPFLHRGSKHLLNRRSRASKGKNRLGVSLDSQRGEYCGQSLSIEPWGWNEPIPEEMITNWHPTI